MSADDDPAIFTCMAAVMAEIGAIGKDSRNKQQGFNFRGVDAVVNTVGPALRKYDVVPLPTVLRTEHRTYNTVGGTAMNSWTVEVRYTLYATDGSSVSGTAPGEAADAGDKGLTKAMSVAYRTFLLQTFAIPTDEPDPDSTVADPAAGRPTERSQPVVGNRDGHPRPAASPASGTPSTERVCSICKESLIDGRPIKKAHGPGVSDYVHTDCATEAK